MQSPIRFWPWALGAVSAPAQTAATDTPTQISSGRAPGNQCNAQAAQSLVGQVYAPAMLKQALTSSGADVARVLREDSIITKELQPGRLNVVLDAAGQRVVRVQCG